MGSIFSARFIVQGGSQWCISLGLNISLFLMSLSWWMDELTAPFLVHIMYEMYLFIAWLITQVSKTHTHNIVQQVLCADIYIASTILKTPLLNRVREEKLIWKAQKHGLYSLESAYWVCVEELVDTPHLTRPWFWSEIWRVKVPSKIKK